MPRLWESPYCCGGGDGGIDELIHLIIPYKDLAWALRTTLPKWVKGIVKTSEVEEIK